MRSTYSSAAALLGAVSMASAQTFTNCNPTQKSCPSDPALGTTMTTDFTKVSGTSAPAGWSYAGGTSMTYDGANGAVFSISTKTGAPTMSATKYIMFGKVTAVVKASPGTGIVSSFILESDDLDEIDWEWLGSTDSSVESNFFGKGNTTSYDRAVYHPVAQPIETYNTYVIDWTSESVKWYINDLNNPVRTLNYGDSLANFGSNYPQTPMMVKMGSWVGCPDASDPAIAGTCQWAGGQAVFPATYNMYVKSVTIEDYGCGTSYSYGDLSGSYQSIVASGGCNGKSASSGSSGKGSSAASSSTKGGVFAGSSTSSSASKATSGSSSSQTSSGSSAASTTPSSSTGSSASQTSSGSSTSTSPAGAASTNNSSSRYGALDFGVMALGLAIGYVFL